MILKTLTLDHFRLYTNCTIDAHPQLNIIIGDNAQGKTSLIESLYVLGLTKSHKTSNDQTLIQKGSDFTKISGLFDFNEQTVQMDMIISKQGKKAKYNKIDYQRLSDYVGYLNVVMFAPEDLELIKGGPAERRRFLDLEIGQLSKAYLFQLNHYKRILKERNETLKLMQKQKLKDDTLLDVLTDQLVHYAEKIMTERNNFIGALNEKVSPIYQLLSDQGEIPSITYHPSIVNDLKQAYNKRKQLDIMSGTTTLGPHRDDIGFYFKDDSVKDVGSQGQIRSIALSLRLSMIDLLIQTKNQPPIVLLDDVLSELDRHRQKNLLNVLSQSAQIFMTTTDLDSIPSDTITNYALFEIEQGRIKRSEIHGRKTL